MPGETPFSFGWYRIPRGAKYFMLVVAEDFSVTCPAFLTEAEVQLNPEGTAQFWNLANSRHDSAIADCKAKLAEMKGDPDAPTGD